MNAPINLLDLVRELGQRPRGRACAVLTTDVAAQKAWAAELARQSGSDHLDLLDLLATDSALAAKIDGLSPASLFEFLASRGSAAKVLVASGLEVILATWRADSAAPKQFAGRLELWEKKPALLFVLQRDSTLQKHVFTRYPQYRFVMDQSDTVALT
jgi:hypothetical protein